MSARKATNAGSSDMQMIKMACSRRRARCTHETCYNHSNLAAYVQSALGDSWRIVLPPELGKVKPPSEYPECDDASIDLVARTFGISRLEAADSICGHCETAAVALSEEVIKVLKESTPQKRSAVQPDDVLLRAMQSMESTLSSSSLQHQVDVLFAALQRAVRRGDSTDCTEVQSLLRMWQPCLGAAARIIDAVEAESSTGDCMDLFQRCTAGTADAPRIIQAVAQQCKLAVGTGCMPLYLVNYIFDGDELSAYDMKHGKDETAMYSFHVLGLVFDGCTHTVYLCDPNGPLMPGGNMYVMRGVPHIALCNSRGREMLSLPWTALRSSAGVKGTTAVSCYDRDQAERETRPEKPNSKAKGFKRGRGSV